MALTITQTSRLKLHQGSIYTLETGADERYFFSAGSEGLVARWDVNSLNTPVAVAKVEGHIFSLLFLPEKNHLVIGTMSGGLHVIDLNLKKEIHYITFHEQSIFDIKKHHHKIFVCSKDGSLSIWNAELYKLEKVITISSEALRAIAFHPLKNEAAIGSSDNKVYLFDTKKMEVISSLEGPENSVFSLSYNQNGNELIAGSRDAQLYVYSLSDFKLKLQTKAHLFTINHMTFIAENQFLVTASRDKTIRIWNSETMELQKVLDKEKYDGHINSVNKLLWLGTQNILVSCSDDRSIIVWKVET